MRKHEEPERSAETMHAAIERVLDAEQRVQRRIEAARERARRTMARSAEDVARIAGRSRTRIVALRQRCDRALTRELGSVAAEGLAPDAAGGDPGAIEQLVHEVALELIGGSRADDVPR